MKLSAGRRQGGHRTGVFPLASHAFQVRMKAALAVLLLSGAAAFLPSSSLVARGLCSFRRRSSLKAPDPGLYTWRYSDEEEEECTVPDEPLGEPVVVDDQLGKIMDEIWDNRHQYDPCKPVRGRLIAKSGNTMRVDIPTQLASLDELLAKGVIDEEEFSIAKAKVLNLPTNVP